MLVILASHSGISDRFGSLGFLTKNELSSAHGIARSLSRGLRIATRTLQVEIGKRVRHESSIQRWHDNPPIANRQSRLTISWHCRLRDTDFETDCATPIWPETGMMEERSAAVSQTAVFATDRAEAEGRTESWL